MVSTRLMSNGGNSSNGDPASGELASSRTTRHSVVQATSPQHQSTNMTVSTLAKYNLVPPPRVFTTALLELPPEILEKIFRMLSYKNVAHLRLVCGQFNTLCGSILNSTFQKLQTQMLNRFQAIKSKMPRRESARRNHPLACESDIIETLHMRLCLLQMTFGKHIERKHCCFFPGEILDEVYRILDYLKVTTNLPRPYKITDEIFDLSSMAMEYYKEHIEPNLPEITYFGTEYFDITGAFSPGESSKSYLCLDSPGDAGAGDIRDSSGDCRVTGRRGSDSMLLDESLPPTPPPPQSNMVLRKRIHRIKQGMKRYNNQLTALRTDLRSCKRKSAWQQKQIAEQQKQMAESQKTVMEHASRFDDYDKKNEEISRKFQTLLQELNKCKTELQYWRSKSPAVPALCIECGVSLGHLGPFAPPLMGAAVAAGPLPLILPGAIPLAMPIPALAEPEIAITTDTGVVLISSPSNPQLSAVNDKQSSESPSIGKKIDTETIKEEVEEKRSGVSSGDESPTRRGGTSSGDEGPSNKRARCSSDDGVSGKKRRFNRSIKPRKCL